MANKEVKFTDVQRRSIIVDTVDKDGVEVLAVEKEVPGGSSKRLLLLNKYDAHKLKESLEYYLNTIYSKEMLGNEGTLSPADMAELFGEDDEFED